MLFQLTLSLLQLPDEYSRKRGKKIPDDARPRIKEWVHAFVAWLLTLAVPVNLWNDEKDRFLGTSLVRCPFLLQSYALIICIGVSCIFVMLC